MAFTYDPNRLKTIASRYQGYGENSVDPGNFNSVKPPAQGNDFLGGVFNSIRSAVVAAPGVIGGALHKTFVEEPTAYGKQLRKEFTDPWRATQKIQPSAQRTKDAVSFANNALMNHQISPQDYLRMVKDATEQHKSTVNDVYGKIGVLAGSPLGLNQEHNAKALPVAATVLSLAAAAPGVSSIGSGLGSLGKTGGNVSKVAGRFGNAIDGAFAPGKTLVQSPGVLGSAVNVGGKLVRNELVAQPSLESLMQAPGNIGGIIHGEDVRNNVMNLASIAAPAALTGIAKGAKVATSLIGKNIFDTSGVFDKIVLKTGKTINEDMNAFIKEATRVGSDNPKLTRKAVQMKNRLQVLQDLVLQEYKGNHTLAAQALKDWQSSERKFGSMDLEQAIKEATKHFEARIATQKMAKAGVFGEKFITGKGVSVGRLTKEVKTTIVDRLRSSNDMAKEVQLMRKEGLIKNDNLYGELQDIAKTGNKKYALDSVKQITASKKLPGSKDFGNGYFSTYSRDAGVVKQASETAKLVQGREAKLGFVGNAIRKAGLSPEQMTAEDNRAAFNKFKNAFQSKIDGIGDRSAKSLYKDLNKLAKDTTGVTDIRQLTSRKIANELNLTTEQAKQIIKASKDSYKVLSTAERGLAGKLMDFNLRVNPIAAPYSRAQSVLRYEANPFFRLQENIETRTGLAALGGKNVMPRTHKYDETIQKLNGRNGIFTSGYGGEGADSFSGSFSGVGAKISRDQQSNIAASIEKFAGGPQNVDKWLKNPKNADLLNDIKTVVQYPDKGFTSSNLAKMMNLVSFPSRYNLKVTGFAVKQLQKQPGAVQMSIIKGLGDFNDFVQSPEGIKWQADNKEVIGLVKYLTPIMPIASVYQTVTGQNKTLMDTGMMGGLPFGIISRVLQGQGVLKDRVPYVDPRTGKVYSDKIPQDLKAKTQSFLESIIDTLYTYPGRTIGSETSKKQVTQGLAENLTFGYTKGGKYSEVDRSKDVTPAQQKQIDVLSKGESKTVPQFNSPSIKSIPRVQTQDVVKGIKFYKPPKGKKAKVKNYGKPISSLI